MSKPDQGSNNHLDARIGSSIRYIRRERKLTIEQLAAPLGLKPRQLLFYETGAVRVPPYVLFQMGEILDVPVVAFFQEQDRRLTQRPSAPRKPDRETLRRELESLDAKAMPSLAQLLSRRGARRAPW